MINGIAGWVFDADVIAEAVRGRRLLNPSIDFTNACNLNCLYCFAEEKNSERKLRLPNELSHQETRGVIRDFVDAGAKTINIVGAGEPTLDAHFEDLIQFISQSGATAVVFTNGIRFAADPSLIDLLYATGASVVLKLNSFDAARQDLVAGRPGYAARRNQVLQALLDRGFAAHEPTRLGVDAVAFAGNLAELPMLHRWARTANVYPIIGEYIPAGRTEDGTFQATAALKTLAVDDRESAALMLHPLSPSERAQLLHTISAIDEQLGVERAAHCAYFGGGQCTQLLGVYVDIRGDIWPCVARQQLNPPTRAPLGNTRRGDRPSSIWQQHPYMHYLREHYDGGCPYKAPLHDVRGAGV